MWCAGDVSGGGWRAAGGGSADVCMLRFGKADCTAARFAGKHCSEAGFPPASPSMHSVFHGPVPASPAPSHLHPPCQCT